MSDILYEADREMVFFQWSERMSVGVAELDADHQTLFRLIDRLHDAVEFNEGRSALDQIFESPSSYIETHFAHEERVGFTTWSTTTTTNTGD